MSPQDQGKEIHPTLLAVTTIVLMTTIATAGYLTGRNRPTPPWIEHYLIPGLGWLGLVLIMIVVVDWLRNLYKSHS